MSKHLLLVHAHPDDESIGQGATMARYVSEGVGVTLVTCTGGEMGEILVPELGAHGRRPGRHPRRPAPDRARQGDGGARGHRPPLPRRVQALPRLRHAVARRRPRRRRRRRARQRLLERRPHRGRQRPRAGDPRGPAAGAGHLRRVRRLRPPRPHPGPPGGDVRRRARRRPVLPAATSGEAWDVAKIYWGAMSASRIRDGIRRLREAGDTTIVRGHGPRQPAGVRDRGRRPDVRRSTARRSSSRRWPRSGRTRPRSPSTGRSSR